ncbi:MAG: M14-type cytosolic carboxypeptidase [Nannocystaceae bacterium]
MKITSAFDGGNIEVVAADQPDSIRLNIRVDNASDHFQWFYYRVSGARGEALRMRLENAGKASFTDGWEGYQAVASYDRQRWFRVPTSYADEVLTIAHTPEADAVYYAYFAPYSQERHADQIARAQRREGVRLEVLGSSCDGRDIDLLVIGEPAEGKRACWIIARQHPGETMAEWLVEGLLERLLDPEDPVARTLRAGAVFYVVPCMNPDGAFRGHLRVNAKGANLNREWLEPTMERSPEVALVRARMEATGVDFFLDVHGDEGLPYNFIAGADGVSSLTDRQTELQADFEAALRQASPDFQSERGYPKADPGEANMTMATNYVADAFGCLSMTLEQPFKDAANHPLPEVGWSPARCRKLGVAILDALFAVRERLR